MTALIPITRREGEVLEALVKYDRNKEIASALFLSIHTVKAHVANLKEKFSVGSRHRLVALAYCWGFLPVGKGVTNAACD